MLNLKEAKKKFFHYLENVKNFSNHTLQSYYFDLKAFHNFLHLEKINIEDLNEVDKRLIREFLAHLTLKKASKRTLIRRLATLRSFFKYLKRENLIDENPMEEIASPKLEKGLPKALSYAQVERLLQQPDIQTYLGFRDRCVMELLYSSGIRISELALLNREDFDSRNLRLRIRGKGKKERVIPITYSAAKWIVDYLSHPDRKESEKGAIFLNKWGKRISVRSLDRNFAKYLFASGLSKGVTPHTIRHTIATHWHENGMDLKTIQKLLGHSSLVTTTIYTHVSTRLKRETYDRAHPSVKLQKSLSIFDPSEKEGKS